MTKNMDDSHAVNALDALNDAIVRAEDYLYSRKPSAIRGAAIVANASDRGRLPDHSPCVLFGFIRFESGKWGLAYRLSDELDLHRPVRPPDARNGFLRSFSRRVSHFGMQAGVTCVTIARVGKPVIVALPVYECDQWRPLLECRVDIRLEAVRHLPSILLALQRCGLDLQRNIDSAVALANEFFATTFADEFLGKTCQSPRTSNAN